MERTHHRLRVGLLALLGAVQLAGCSDPLLPEETVATLEITTELPSFLVPDESLQLQAVARDAAGVAVEGVTISWTSSDQAVAMVSPTGLVTAVAEGPSTITATVLTVSSSAQFPVTTASTSFPSNPHFSRLIGGTHGANVTFWAAGSLASDGIKEMAELGQITPLDSEVEAAIQAGTAEGLLSGGGIPLSPGSQELMFDISVDFPLVTLVSMVAPSPDWFLGVNSLSLLEEGSWVDSVVIELFAYDAGTDSGVIYTSANEATDPRANISRLTESPFNVMSPMGTFTFTRRTGS